MKNAVRGATRELPIELPSHAKNEGELAAAFTTKPGESGCFRDADTADGTVMSVDLRPQRLSFAPQLQLIGQLNEWIDHTPVPWTERTVDCNARVR